MFFTIEIDKTSLSEDKKIGESDATMKRIRENSVAKVHGLELNSKFPFISFQRSLRLRIAIIIYIA